MPVYPRLAQCLAALLHFQVRENVGGSIRSKAESYSAAPPRGFGLAGLGRLYMAIYGIVGIVRSLK